MEFNIGSVKNAVTNLEKQVQALSQAMTGASWNDEVSASYVSFLTNCRSIFGTISGGVADIGNAANELIGIDPSKIVEKTQSVCDALKESK